MNLKKVESPEHFAQLLDDNNNIYMYSASWCPDCVALYPDIDALAAKFPNFNIYYFDVEELRVLSRHNKVLGIPCFVKYENKEEQTRFGKGQRITIEEVEQFLTALTNE